MAGEAAAEPGLDLAEREVDLVVDGDDPVQRHLQRAAGGPGRVPDSFMKVSGCRIATRGPPGRVRPSARRPRNLSLARGRSQRRASSASDLEADVVAGAGVLGARVAEPDDEDALALLAALAAAEQTHGDYLLPAGVA